MGDDDAAKREAHRAYQREYKRRRRAEDPEWVARQKLLAAERRRKHFEAHPEALEKHRAYAREHRRKLRESDPEGVRAYKRAYDSTRKKADPVYLERERERQREGSRRRGDNRRRAFGLTPDQVEELRAEQSGRCAVCSETPTPYNDGRDPLHIDHRHDNGAVRGMLCGRCNRNAAVLDMDPDYLRRRAEYVQRGADPDTHMVAVVEPLRPRLREVS